MSSTKPPFLRRVLAGVFGPLSRVFDGDYITLDCRSSVHSACAECSCACHRDETDEVVSAR